MGYYNMGSRQEMLIIFIASLDCDCSFIENVWAHYRGPVEIGSISYEMEINIKNSKMFKTIYQKSLTKRK